MKHLFNLICLLIAQRTYSAYLWICSETLPRDCDYRSLSKKIKNRIKIFKAFLDATRLSPKATLKDSMSEATKLKEVENDMLSRHYDKINVTSRQ